jgi:FkbH-like protein
MTSIYETLTWLPTAPSDFPVQLRAAHAGQTLRALAGHALDENQLQKLAKRLKLLKSEGADLNGLMPLSIGLLSNATTQSIAPAISATGLRYGLQLELIEAPFNQVAQEAFSAEPSFSGCAVDAVLIALDCHGLPIRISPGDAKSAQQTVDDCIHYIKSVVSAVRQKTGAQIILQNIVPAGQDIFGSFERQLPGTMSWLTTRVNVALDDWNEAGVYILDVAGLAAKLGYEAWHDPTLWNMTKLSFAQKYLPVYADYVGRILAATQGKSRRCLVLDLDNTLWGGVIGDDGLEGILIGQGDPTAEAHLLLQKRILELRARGIVLAVSSKNEDAVARLPFRDHPDMLLRESDIAVFQANWRDKASNIQAIAQSLSLGLESLVFLDDNPAERMQVRQALPEVAVPELPDDPAYFTDVLFAAGYFEAVAFSQEDQQRAAFYQENAKREQVLSQASDMNAYLQSLAMEITLAPFDSVGRPRIAQLISKSNQFNLTTKRYSEAEIKQLEEDGTIFTRQIRLKDTFGDNGMISVLVCKKNDSMWEIDTWLMSCRVLGRRVEEAVLQEIVSAAVQENVQTIVGVYRPTARNVIVKDHYKNLGFKLSDQSSEEERWELSLLDYKNIDLHRIFYKIIVSDES